MLIFAIGSNLIVELKTNKQLKYLQLMSQITGHISQIIGPVIDVYFDTEGQDAEKVLPKIHDALKIDRGDGRDLIVEVQQHIGEDTIPTVCTVGWRLSRWAHRL